MQVCEWYVCAKAICLPNIYVALALQTVMIILSYSAVCITGIIISLVPSVAQ